ncbi:hypothetical protein N7478_005406 [Penicillium angulare]|uniref:uncharacterized protein n=1 Tax=Penicillium angulare TaxID=116970 RepID=UPI0025410881|nr:uncharacterized protein N7478_005406 [Penicillium angulare]KAJ5280034.1 hypothetical protein N7478_005406 [Penicillium angulare]
MHTLHDPDGFGVSGTYEHGCFGILEFLQNTLLDFYEAKGNWKEQWVVCQSLFLWTNRLPMEDLLLLDDGEQVEETSQMLRTMFLTMLATLEQEGLLGPGSEVKNLATSMKLHFALGRSEQSGMDPLAYDDTDRGVHVLAYAKKHKDLKPSLPRQKQQRPLKWSAELSEYKRRYGSHGRGLGGDRFDFTTWASADRKASSYDGKDLLTRIMINTLKEGLVMQPA